LYSQVILTVVFTGSSSLTDDDNEQDGSNESDQTDSSDSNPSPQHEEVVAPEPTFRRPNPPAWTRIFEQMANRHPT
jgi:hypothetical protein